MHILEPHLIMDLYLVGLEWNPGIYIFNKIINFNLHFSKIILIIYIFNKRFSYTQWWGGGWGAPRGPVLIGASWPPSFKFSKAACFLGAVVKQAISYSLHRTLSQKYKVSNPRERKWPTARFHFSQCKVLLAAQTQDRKGGVPALTPLPWMWWGLVLWMSWFSIHESWTFTGLPAVYAAFWHPFP